MSEFNTLIEQILSHASKGNKSLIVENYIGDKDRKELNKRGYSIIEVSGTYLIKW